VSAARRIFVSDAKFEFPHLRFLTVTSGNLRGRGDIIVFVPPGCEGRRDLPLAIFLHGVGSSGWAWILNAGLHRTAERLMQGDIAPMVVAMPSDGLYGEGSGYLPHLHADYESWIIEDVVESVRATIPQAGPASQIFLSGFSMGGFGALRIAAQWGDRVRAVSGHASITHLDQIAPFFKTDANDPYRLKSGTAPSVIDLMLRHRDRLPAIRFDVPAMDHLLEPNRELHRQLEQAGIAHTFEIFDGIHEWDFCERHAVDTLKFFDQA
jgi:putative tributyrin esterase